MIKAINTASDLLAEANYDVTIGTELHVTLKCKANLNLDVLELRRRQGELPSAASAFASPER